MYAACKAQEQRRPLRATTLPAVYLESISEICNLDGICQKYMVAGHLIFAFTVPERRLYPLPGYLPAGYR